jgi:hypothetical protein
MAELRVTRASLLRGSVALAAGGAALAAWPVPTRSAPSPQEDAAILRFGLLLEDLQAAFYADALRRGALKGELLEFAQVVGGHEKAHAATCDRRWAPARPIHRPSTSARRTPAPAASSAPP